MAAALRSLTWLDVVRQEMGEWLPVDFCDYILWQETAFPFADVEHVRMQVREFREGGTSGEPV